MISLDQALNIYTDRIHDGKDIDLNYFYENLAQDDIKEFKELSEIINLTLSIEYTKDFNDIFDEINSYKEQLYLPSVANFRKDTKDFNEDKDAQKTIDEIFDKEFNDE